MSKYLVVLSGGLDSTTCLAKTIHDHGVESVGTVTFDYGSKHNAIENAAAATIAVEYGVKHGLFIQLPFISEHFKSNLLASGGDIPEGHYEDETMKQTVVPFRNGIMLSIAAGLAASHGYTHLVLGSHLGDHAIYPDCRSEFVRAMRDAIKLGTWNGIEVTFPVQELDKAGVVKLAHSLGVPFGLTHTCYNGTRPPCGKCGACQERAEAFALNGLTDPLVSQ